MEPFEHQRRALAFTLALRRSALFAETGTGKTFVALNNIEIRIKRGRIRRALVIAPSSILKVGWFDDAVKFSSCSTVIVHKDQGKLFSKCAICGKGMRQITKKHLRTHGIKDREQYFKDYGLPLGERWRRRKTIAEMLKPGFDIYITNPETIALNLEAFKKERFDMVVLDESTMIKNATAKRTTAIISVGDMAKYTLALTGTPRGNHLYDLWAQMRFVDGCLGTSYPKFLKKYFYQPSPQEWPMMWVPRSSSESKVQDLIERRVLTIKKDDCLDLPERSEVIKRVPMSPSCSKHYESLVEDGFTIIKESEEAIEWLEERRTEENSDEIDMRIKSHEITPSTMRAQMLKLIQVSGGFCIDDDGTHVSITRSPQKLDVLKSIVSSTDEKVVVWAYFREDFSRLEEAFGDNCVTLNGATNSSSIPALVDRFKDPEGAQVMLAHPQSAKFGHTWTWATLCVYYSFMDTIEDYMQSRDRIYRIGQTRKVTEYAILGSPVEEAIWGKLKSGADMSSSFISVDSFRGLLSDIGSSDEYAKI